MLKISGRLGKIAVMKTIVPPVAVTRDQEIDAALDRVRAYLEQGRRKELQGALIKEGLSFRTIKNWLKNKGRVRQAYKVQNLTRLFEHLPPLDDPRFDAYKFVLSELDVSMDSQKDVQKYHGSYELMHVFSGQHTKDIKFLKIDTRIMRGLNVFGMRYRVHDGIMKCDGFVFIRGNRLYLLGLSASTLFFAVFKAVSDPRKTIIYGMSMIEDVTDEEIWFSNSCLVSEHLQLNGEQLDRIKKHLGDGSIGL